MKYAFYITNHGFGHASRNVPIIKRILELDSECEIYVKTDLTRCEFLRLNFSEKLERVFLYSDCEENGLILVPGKLIPDFLQMEQSIKNDFKNWNSYIGREKKFLTDYEINIVISDVIPWALAAAKACNIPSILIGNFNWSEMYKSYYSEDIWGPYSECYKLTDKAIWYEIHAEELHSYCKNYECVSLISRTTNMEEVKRIKEKCSRKIVFVSLGASAEIEKPLYVGDLPYDFFVTRGIKLVGENVQTLPSDMINTPDYIAASDYVIAKGGWSTVAEILLHRKKCALLFRGENSEDKNTKKILEERGQCVGICGNELIDVNSVINRIKELHPDSYDMYKDDTNKVCKIILDLALRK